MAPHPSAPYPHKYHITRYAQVLVEAVAEDGTLISLQLQNAETVKLVGPASTLALGPASTPALGPAGYIISRPPESEEEKLGEHGRKAMPRSCQGSRTISVADLKVGDHLLALLQEGARHTGIAIQEFIIER